MSTPRTLEQLNDWRAGATMSDYPTAKVIGRTVFVAVPEGARYAWRVAGYIDPPDRIRAAAAISVAISAAERRGWEAGFTRGREVTP